MNVSILTDSTFSKLNFSICIIVARELDLIYINKGILETNWLRIIIFTHPHFLKFMFLAGESHDVVLLFTL